MSIWCGIDNYLSRSFCTLLWLFGKYKNIKTVRIKLIYLFILDLIYFLISGFDDVLTCTQIVQNFVQSEVGYNPRKTDELQQKVYADSGQIGAENEHVDAQQYHHRQR